MKYNIDTWPKNKHGHNTCTKVKPMPIELKNIGKWEHEDAEETPYDGDNYIEYRCPNCAHIFRVEMPD